MKWIAMVAVTALVAAACDNGNEGDAVPAEGYLEQLGEVEAARDAAFDDVGTTLRGTYTDRSRFFDAVNAIDTSAFQAALVEAQDLVGVFVTAQDTLVETNTVVATTDPTFCRALVHGTAGAEQRQDAACLDPQQTPGGDYGLAARQAALRFPAEIVPRIAAPLHLGSDDEIRAYLEVVQPEVERIFTEILDELRALEPPEQLTDDHAAAITFFEESAVPGRELARTLSEDGQTLFGPLFPEETRSVANAT